MLIIYLQDLSHNTIFSSDLRTNLKRKEATLLQNHIHATSFVIIAYYDRFKDLQTHNEEEGSYIFIYLEWFKILVKF